MNEREQRYAEAVGKAATELGVNDFWGSDSNAIAEAVMAVADAEQAELRVAVDYQRRALAAEAKVARIEALIARKEASPMRGMTHSGRPFPVIVDGDEIRAALDGDL